MELLRQALNRKLQQSRREARHENREWDIADVMSAIWPTVASATEDRVITLLSYPVRK